MLKFGISKNVEYGNVCKYAILEGDEWEGCIKLRAIETNSDGKEYFSLPNKRDKSFLKSFTVNIGDAIDEVVNGYGDAIKHNILLGVDLFSVIYFLDREYGEEMKRKSIEGWKDTEFAWVLTTYKGGYVDQFGCITYDGKIAKHYGTEEEALKYLNDITDETYRFLEKYKGKFTKDYFTEFKQDLNKTVKRPVVHNVDKMYIVEAIIDGITFDIQVPRDQFDPTNVFTPFQMVIEANKY